VVACLIAVLVALASCGSSNDVDLNGTWAAKGYYCPAGVPHDETIQVVQTGSHVVGTKTVGDDCVKAGHVSFEGDLTGRTGQVKFWTSTPNVPPAIQAQPLTLQIADDDHFGVTFGSIPMTFTRTASPASPALWWLLALVLLLAGLAVLVVVGRRRRASRSGTGTSDR
jgi:hypothetical protein